MLRSWVFTRLEIIYFLEEIAKNRKCELIDSQYVNARMINGLGLFYNQNNHRNTKNIIHRR